MSLDYAKDLWSRACNAQKSAEALLPISPDDAASRTYYAAFNGVSAALALRDKTFTRHSAVRAAVHRELVKTGIWDIEIGADFDTLWELRDLGDYGGSQHVSSDDAKAAIEAARRILDAIRSQNPELRFLK